MSAHLMLVGLIRKGALVLWLAMAASAVQAQAVVIGAEDDWAPYSSVESGLPKGMAVDIVRAIFTEAGMPLELVSLPYERCMSEAKVGRLAGCFDTVADAQMQRDYLLHAQPLFVERPLILVRKDSKATAAQLRDLENKTVLVTLGYTYGDAFEGNKKIKRLDAIGDINVLRMLKEGKADYAVVFSRILPYLMRAKGSDMQGDFKVIGTLPESRLYLTFSRRWPGGAEVVKKFNAAHARLLKNQTIATIEKRWE